MSESHGIAVMLDVSGRRVVVVGTGAVGVRRAKRLAAAGARVVQIDPQITDAARIDGADIRPRPFEPNDLEGALLVVCATDDPEVNAAVAHAAAERGTIVNRADNAPAGDFQFMASHRDGPLTLAVHTGGASANAAGRIRDEIANTLDPDWPRLLELARPMRQQIQARVDDPTKRAGLLKRLCDDQALATLKAGGDAALQALYAGMMQDLA